MTKECGYVHTHSVGDLGQRGYGRRNPAILETRQVRDRQSRVFGDFALCPVCLQAETKNPFANTQLRGIHRRIFNLFFRVFVTVFAES